MWLALAFFQESYVYYMMGIGRADAAIHWRIGVQSAERLAYGEWPFGPGIPLGNRAYVAYLAVLRFLTGASIHTPVMINGFAAFAGGLALVRALARLFPYGNRRSSWFLVLIFFPSTVFWTTSNMKEGFMYWGVCQILAAIVQAPVSGRITASFSTIAGAAVTAILRPHIAVIWLSSGAVAFTLMRGKRGWAIAMILLLPVVSTMTEVFVGRNLLSPGEAIQVMETQFKGLDDPRAGSHIDYGPEGPTFFVSGFTSIFFRPFPWQIGSLRVLVASAETWSLTILLFVAWLTATPYQRSYLLRLPAVWAAVVVCFFFSIIFTYLPNEGLMVRQRVQMVPALLVLALLPYLARDYLNVLPSILYLRSRISEDLMGSGRRK